MQDTSVLYTKKETIGILTFNRPDNRNSMDAETLKDFKHGLTQVRNDKLLRCLVITGSGNTFCGGADLRNSIVSDGSVLSPDVLMDFYRPFLSVGLLKIPVIAAINGHAIGGGFGLALLCDIRIVNQKAKLGANFARLGIHSGMAVSYILPRLIGVSRACELLFTGKVISGDKAASIGLAGEALHENEVMDHALALAHDISQSAPVAVQMMKQSIYSQLSWNHIQAAGHESEYQARTFAMDDAGEGIAALLEKREPHFTGK